MAAKKLSARAKWGLFGAAGLFGGTAYSFYRYVTHHRDIAEVDTSAHSSTCAFNALADRYDAAIGAEETWMGFGILRSWYLKKYVKGDVLEISAGTGRNLPYYNYPAITSLTLTDLSRPMLTRAEDKYFDELRIGYRHPETRIRFAISDAHCIVQQPQQSATAPAPEPASGQTPNSQRRAWWARTPPPATPPTSPTAATAGIEDDTAPTVITPTRQGGGSLFNIFRVLMPGGMTSRQPDHLSPAFTLAHTFDDSQTQGCCSTGQSLDGELLTRFPAASFDTVVDTFGLCSHTNPVKVLKQAARLCKPDGKVVLIEHGRGTSDWMNKRLDDGCEDHKHKWGCYWNRDILAIVRQAGLAVEYISRWHFGTTYIIVARPA